MGIVDGVRFCDACGTTVSRDEPLHADSFGREICGDCLSKLDGCDLDIKSTLNSTPGAQEIAQEPGRALNAVGNTDAVCPHCDHTLEKKPGRKKKCPHCCHFIYVRTRPSDRQRVLVTEAQAEQIEEQWSIANGTHDAFMAKTNRFADEKAKLKKRFGGGEPSDNDVRWGLLNQERTEHAGQRDWGLYSNATFEMAELLKKEGKTTRALQFYLEVCYHDLNGPNNTGGVTDKDLLREFPPWDPGGPGADLAPGVIDRALRMIKASNLAPAEVEEMYYEVASAVHKSLRPPLSPADAWPQIRDALFGNAGG